MSRNIDREQLVSGLVELLQVPEREGMRRFRMLAYTGAEFGRLYGQAVIDVAGIECPAKLPILLNHAEGDVVGYATVFTRNAKGLTLEGYVSLSTDAGRQVAVLSDEGFPFTASVGLSVLSREDVQDGVSVQVNGNEHRGPLQVWRRSKLFETSFITACPADAGTGAAVLSEGGAVPLPALHPLARMRVGGGVSEAVAQSLSRIEGPVDVLNEAQLAALIAPSWRRSSGSGPRALPR